MFQFELSTPYQIHNKHTYYLNGVQAAITKGGSDCTAEDVMKALYNGKVYLYNLMNDEGTEHFGFVLLQEYTDCYSDKLVLHVDFAFLPGAVSNLMRLYQSLPAFAAAKGFDQISFSSNRKGWEKYRERTGFNGATRVFYKDLQHG
jgi:hypothetical protein